ncbi:MAG: hypothetical protein IJJ26_00465, partial [Victivallales bacterium]|nr:hypothetical protein [Victivallales bacterium]
MNPVRTERLPNGNIKVIIPVVFRQTATGRRIDAADEPPAESDNRQAMLLAIARGRRWQRLIDDNEVGSAKDIAERIGRDVSYVARIIRMADLAPSIVHSIIAGDCPDRLSLD